MIGLIILITGLFYLFIVVDSLGIPLFLIFLILQLCGVIAWSWVMVCLPLIFWASCLLLTFVFSAILSCLTNDI